MSKEILSGNEAIARGARDAGVTVGAGYPGTPSTEILEHFSALPGVYAEWSVNEKVAFEVGMGAALAGARTLVTMKHVGVNVAADPLFTASYVGVKGALVLVGADDPAMHSSQNEQDNRHYARAAKLPMLDPSDSQEAYDFARLAVELSERFDTPVYLRTTTRVSHGQSVVQTLDAPPPAPAPAGFTRDAKKYVMIPAYARLRHVEVEKRLLALAEWAENTGINRVEAGEGSTGFVCSGIAYQYVREAFPDAPVLKLGMAYPLPARLLKSFAASVRRLVVVEELDPFYEDQLKALGLAVEGKNLFPLVGELDPALVRDGVLGTDSARPRLATDFPVPPRPPALCAGCPHREVFQALKNLGLVVTGDIGCYTLGVLPPFTAMDTCIDMGASITLGQGIEIAQRDTGAPAPVAVIGDSTFAHSGITGLINAAYNGRRQLIIVLDNGTTAMTGMQDNPFSGATLLGADSFQLDYGKLAEAVGIEAGNFRLQPAWKLEGIQETIKSLLDTGKLSLLVVKGTCVLLKRKQAKKAGA